MSEPIHTSSAPALKETDKGSGKPEEGKDEPSQKPDLTAEEQMALFEEELKETDWGHQPC